MPNLHWMAFSASEPQSTPAQQLAPESERPQPAALATVHAALAAASRRAALRSAGPSSDVQMPPAPPVPVPTPATPALPRHKTLGELLHILGVPKPWLDAAGTPLTATLLSRGFQTGLDGMAEGSGGRRQLLQAASALVYHALRPSARTAHACDMA